MDKRQLKWAHYILVAFMVTSLLAGCRIEPPLNLHIERHVNVGVPWVKPDLNVFWSYEDDGDWQANWSYGWDDTDKSTYGDYGYSAPTTYYIRRYFKGSNPDGPRLSVVRHTASQSYLTAQYEFGYYDFLTWTGNKSLDEVVNNEFTESSDYTTVMLTTNKSPYVINRAATNLSQTYYEPDEVFRWAKDNVYVSENPDHYDGYDAQKNVYTMNLAGKLEPIVYIYLPQVVLYNNKGRITSVDGNASVGGMSKSVNVSTGMTSDEPINVFFATRMKKNQELANGKKVDVIGGRFTTFGLCNTKPNEITKASEVSDKYRHLMGVNIQFSNGKDSTMVFDVTKQVRKAYRGGVITVELDVDTVKLPNRSGGSGFDVSVKDFVDHEYDFEM